MAGFVRVQNTVVSKTSGSSVSFLLTETVPAGNVLTVHLFYDNNGTDSPTPVTVSGPWTAYAAYSTQPAGGGVNTAVWIAESDGSAAFQKNATIGFSLSAAVTAKAGVVVEWEGVYTTPVADQVDTYAGNFTSAVAVGYEAGSISIGSIGIEGTTYPSWTSGTKVDTSAIVDPLGTSGQGAASNAGGTVAYRVSTGTSSTVRLSANGGTDGSVHFMVLPPKPTGPVTHQITARSDATATTSASATSTARVNATTDAAVETRSGATLLAAIAGFTDAVATVSAVADIARETHQITGAVEVTATVSGSVAARRAAAGRVDASTSTSASPALKAGVTAQSTASASTALQAALLARVAGTTDATATTSATPGAIRPVRGTVDAAVVTLLDALVTSGATIHQITAAVNAVAATSAQTTLRASVAGRSEASTETRVQVVRLVPVAGTSTASTTTSAQAARVLPVAGVAEAQTSTSAAVSALLAAVGRVLVESDVLAEIAALRPVERLTSDAEASTALRVTISGYVAPDYTVLVLREDVRPFGVVVLPREVLVDEAGRPIDVAEALREVPVADLSRPVSISEVSE